MSRKKEKLQTLIFEMRFFPNRTKVKSWIHRNGFTMDKRKKKPIEKYTKSYRCKQRNADWFKKKTFKKRKLSKGVYGIFGYMKRK